MLLIPGWSTTSDIFKPYESIFKNAIFYNWGYSDSHPRSCDESIIADLKDQDFGIFCYSLGTLKALELSQQITPKKIISVSGFTSFCGEKSLNKKRRLQLNLMIKGLKTDSQKTLSDFCEKAELGDNNMPGLTNTDDLIEGLVKLRDLNFSDLSKSSKLDILLIEGTQDPIVPKSVSQDLLDGPGTRQLFSIYGGHGIIKLI